MGNPPELPHVPISNAELEYITKIGRQIQPSLREIPAAPLLRNDHLDPSVLKIMQEGRQLFDSFPIDQMQKMATVTLLPKNLIPTQEALANIQEMWPRIAWGQVDPAQISHVTGSIQNIDQWVRDLQEFEQRRREKIQNVMSSVHLASRTPEVEVSVPEEMREDMKKEFQAIVEPMANELKSLVAQVKRLPKKENKSVKSHSDFELSDVVLQLLPGKGNPHLTLSRRDKTIERTLQQAEYDILLCLAKEMRLSRRRSTLSSIERGWVGQDKLLGLIVERSSSKENAAVYVSIIIQRLRDKLESAAKDLGTTVNRLRVVENGAPAKGQKRSLYRLSIPPDQLILPRP